MISQMEILVRVGTGKPDFPAVFLSANHDQAIAVVIRSELVQLALDRVPEAHASLNGPCVRISAP